MYTAGSAGDWYRIDLGAQYTINTVFLGTAERTYPTLTGMKVYVGDFDDVATKNPQCGSAVEVDGDTDS